MQPILGGSNQCGVCICCSFTAIFTTSDFIGIVGAYVLPDIVCVHAHRSHTHPTKDRTLGYPYSNSWYGILSTDHSAHSTPAATLPVLPPWLFSRCTAWTGPPSVRSCPPPCTVGQSPLCPSLCSSETDYPGGGLPAAQRSPFWSVIQTETERQHLRKKLLIFHSVLLWQKESTHLHQRDHINITYHCNLEQSPKLWI